jgi:hypothetical protein
MRSISQNGGSWFVRSVSLCALLAGCEIGGETITVPPLDAAMSDPAAPFVCTSEASRRCVGNKHFSCKRYEEFLEVVELNCGDTAQICDVERVCLNCSPNTHRCQPCEPGDLECDPNQTQACKSDGSAWENEERCNLEEGEACYDGTCGNMCKRAETDRSYVGCTFFAADLDNAAIDDRNNAAVQQFAVAVANPHDVPVDVTVEINDGAFGGDTDARLLSEVTVPPGSLEVFELPQREVDGSSEGELNDGTHSALSSNAFRVHSSHPITAYQFNPLENVNVFSNDASLLLPTSAIGNEYTVISWPQTIGHSNNPENDFDSTSDREDLRAFLTIVGTAAGTDLTVTLGPMATSVVALSGGGTLGPGEQLDLELGPYDVVNLESQGLNVDFTGTLISATQPVTVFVGSEASDVPRFGTYATRQCCADHLEEQLFPDSVAGTHFSVARMPPRTRALAQAARDGQVIDIAVTDEPEWVRVIALTGPTEIVTSLPEPDDLFMLDKGQDRIMRADQDFELNASSRVAVLQALPSQGVTGIPRQYPGGDPSIIAVPPIQQYRRDYIFLTPDKYAFDFVVITAEANAVVLLDDEPVEDRCDKPTPADGIERQNGDPEPERVIYRCQLSFPEITSGPLGSTFPGDQHDGVHTVVSNREVGIVVYGFDRFVSYAYVGGLDLDILQ